MLPGKFISGELNEFRFSGLRKLFFDKDILSANRIEQAIGP